jgi:Flp pilus assembly protein protease CpaA
MILLLGIVRLGFDFFQGETHSFWFPGNESAWIPVAMDIGLFLFLCVCMEIAFRMGLLGGGDGKLIVTLSLWFGMSGFVEFIFLTALWGAVPVMAVYGFRLFKSMFFSFFPTFLPHYELAAIRLPIGLQKIVLAEKNPPIPYAIAIASGTVHAVLLLQFDIGRISLHP